MSGIRPPHCDAVDLAAVQACAPLRERAVGRHYCADPDGLRSEVFTHEASEMCIDSMPLSNRARRPLPVSRHRRVCWAATARSASYCLGKPPSLLLRPDQPPEHWWQPVPRGDLGRGLGSDRNEPLTDLKMYRRDRLRPLRRRRVSILLTSRTRLRSRAPGAPGAADLCSPAPALIHLLQSPCSKPFSTSTPLSISSFPPV